MLSVILLDVTMCLHSKNPFTYTSYVTIITVTPMLTVALFVKWHSAYQQSAQCTKLKHSTLGMSVIMPSVILLDVAFLLLC
jgi:hypothetical protein